ncbi:precorrin-6y C5,15-methyltransferase (decarboxylating) subunit CbiE [Clostridium botulinum]|uniref:Precorrin-6y C5,15-methyltransferase (Decarboxylating) subunit CbiE n=1 Tax=Clostridium botulinum TaxID=1491 RepID=A0A6G4CJP8_CLOBO|nr:precorrin-6y C5,15-methyltransferase (decarboxylating) subunit CbiE [Clostridium botulinum]NEZ98538.1 precorrin-6y C5,15-methyltransferase (decarboxylating) subunit CbiE [Clostridium botulinum]NFA29734.1 precorrin-6y C5,15-methyltransferase (decarboxylating) subunit CbiE [Clostridium botulinum]NFA84103.1 precorrin-6y C5,15-methyltransferase (decarboxylating) subunit CbiE [Clostridium botulinum]NFB06842.1 precorrin-6y C5,15-methyltransferase (decarboxylating) subunit CbiE [Clostridium botulin
MNSTQENLQFRKVYIVGLGPGHKDHMIHGAINNLENVDVIIGFKRAIESLDFIKNNKKIVNKLSEILDYIRENKEENISIVASGDPCFYGISNYIKNNYEDKIEVIPGISSYQYMMAKINESWQNSFLGSLHGREEEFIEKVKDYEKSIWLTDKKNSPDKLCKKLIENNIKAEVTVGENLSYKDERIVKGNPQELENMSFGELTIVYINRVFGFRGSFTTTKV